jgi:uncharacterized membrane protein YidH (DUF202 family)
MDQVLQELVEFVKTASPVIWEALYRQVYVIAASRLLWAIGLAVLIYGALRFAKTAWAWHEEDGGFADYNQLAYVCYVISVVLGTAAFGLVVSAFMRLANPNYYAINLILYKLGGG